MVLRATVAKKAIHSFSDAATQSFSTWQQQQLQEDLP
jgi:hypothetical protein